MFLYKKGISPLIATILLIAFAISLGAMIMNWQTSLSGEPSYASVCDSDAVSLKVHKIGTGQSYCYDATTDTLRFLLINRGKIQIDSLQYTVVDTELNVEELELANSLIAPGKIFKQEISFGKDPSSTSVSLIPRVEGELCPLHELVLENIPSCE